MTDDFDFNDGVFTDNKEAIKTMRDSAQALGINPDLIAPEEDGETKVHYYAKDNCKKCFGRGTLDVCISPSKQKLFWKNFRQPGRISKRKITSKKKLKKRVRQQPSPTAPCIKMVISVSPGNELGEKWDDRVERPDRKPSRVLNRLGFSTRTLGTQRPEPLGYKKENKTKSFCSCVKSIET